MIFFFIILSNLKKWGNEENIHILKKQQKILQKPACYDKQHAELHGEIWLELALLMVSAYNTSSNHNTEHPEKETHQHAKQKH